MVHVSRIFLYPIKSCQGIELKTVNIDARGPIGDRQWMVVDHTGRFISQRTHPQLATVQVQQTTDGLRLHAPGKSALELAGQGEDPVRFNVAIWSDNVLGQTHSVAVDLWFSELIGQECRLVRIADGAARVRLKDFHRSSFQAAFADSAPFLLANEASLSDLNSRMSTALPMERFRANIVVSGAPAYCEEDWVEGRIGAVAFSGLFLCDRCPITTVDQKTGACPSKEPLKTLGTYRKVGGKVFFGVRLIHAHGGRINVGDDVKFS